VLIGLMDHWVPSHDEISRFWKTPFAELRPYLDALCGDIGINNFTFYTKWYSNGIKSSLPFLKNHPQAMSVVTDNGWGRELIDYFHRRDMTAGAMLQCYTFQGGMLPKEAVLGTWPSASKATGQETDVVELVDPAWDEYPNILSQILEEHLRLFPALDAIFLEFEGVSGARIEIGRRMNCAEKMEKTKIMSSAPVQEMLRKTLTSHLSAAERTFARTGYRGVRGVVYGSMGYGGALRPPVPAEPRLVAPSLVLLGMGLKGSRRGSAPADRFVQGLLPETCRRGIQSVLHRERHAADEAPRHHHRDGAVLYRDRKRGLSRHGRPHPGIRTALERGDGGVRRRGEKALRRIVPA